MIFRVAESLLFRFLLSTPLRPLVIFLFGVAAWSLVAGRYRIHSYFDFAFHVFNEGETLILFVLVGTLILMSISYFAIINGMQKRYSESLRKWLQLSVIAVAFVFLISFSSQWFTSGPYGDEQLYVDAGKGLISGQRPDQVNQWHPPLGKYLLGTVTPWVSTWPMLRLPALVAGVVGLATLFLVAWLRRGFLGLAISSALVASSPVLIAALFSAQLESFLLLFTFTAVVASSRLLYVKSRKWLLAAGILYGLALATKWTVAPIIIVTFVFLRTEPLRILLLASLATISYLATYTPTLLANGLPGLFDTHGEMLNCMGLPSWSEARVLAPGCVRDGTSVAHPLSSFSGIATVFTRNFLGIETAYSGPPEWLYGLSIGGVRLVPESPANPGLWLALWLIPAYTLFRGTKEIRLYSATTLASGIVMGFLNPKWSGFHLLAPFLFLSVFMVATTAKGKVGVWLGWWLAIQAGFTWLLF